MALVLNLLDAIPYGLAILPAQFSAFAPLGVTVLHTCSGCDVRPLRARAVRRQVCLLSTTSAQLVMGIGR